MKSLTALFSNWDRAALAETVASAKETLERHNGDFEKALDAINSLAYGNVSLRTRAICDVLRAMERGYA
jgi:hypothetical protein